MKNKVENFYDRRTDIEWTRLDRHHMVMAITLRALNDYLPPPPSTLLDIGGGPGRYAIELARQGYQVTLLDLSQENLVVAVEQAQAAGVTLAQTIYANATHLDMLVAEQFDAVIMLGPMYHLLEEAERHAAVAEAVRVLKPGGVLAAAFLGPYDPITYAATRDPAWIVRHRDVLERILTTGQYRRDMMNNDYFIDAYFAHPTQIPPFMAAHDLTLLTLLSCEGVVGLYEEEINKLTGELWTAWVDLNYRLSTDPSILGRADHLLYVGQKPGS